MAEAAIPWSSFNIHCTCTLPSLELLQIYHKPTCTTSVFASLIAPDGISETLKIQIFLGEDAPRPHCLTACYCMAPCLTACYSTAPRLTACYCRTPALPRATARPPPPRLTGRAISCSSKPKFCNPLSQCLNEALTHTEF